MYSFLRRPAWIALASLTVVLTVVFVNLGLWQLRRLAEVRLENTVITARMASAPAPLQSVVDLASDTETAAAEHAFRPVTVVGSFDPDNEVLIRSQTLSGVAGFHVVTPFELGGDVALLVNRGWVPLTMDTPPVVGAPPPATAEIQVVLQGTQERGRFGPEDPPGIAPRLNRIDIQRIEQQVPYDLYPVYGLATTASGDLPVPVMIEEPTDGPHLPYAIQWFAFAAISVVGFAALARKTARRTGASEPGS